MTDTDDNLTIEAVMEKRDMTRTEVNTHLAYIFSSDTKYAILYVLDLYDMLNLKTLAKMLGKSASTIHKHLEDLAARNYIKVANTVKGKFYELTGIVKDLQAAQQQQFEGRDFAQEIEDLKQMSDEEFLESTLNKFDDPHTGLGPDIILDFEELLTNATSTMKTISQISISATGEAYFHIFLIYLLRFLKEDNIDRFMEQFSFIENHDKYGERLRTYLERQEWNQPLSLDQYRESIITGLAEKKYREIMEAYWNDTLTVERIREIVPLGSTDQTDYFLKLANIDQLARYIEIVINFHQDMLRLQNEFKKENEGVPENQLTTQILNLFSGPLGKM